MLVSESESDTKVVIRGAARATFITDAETVELEGSAATTWVERTLAGSRDGGRGRARSPPGARTVRSPAAWSGSPGSTRRRTAEPAAEPDAVAGPAGVATELPRRRAEVEPEPEARAVIIPPEPSPRADGRAEPEPEPDPSRNPSPTTSPPTRSDAAAHPVPVRRPQPDPVRSRRPEPPIPSAPAPPVTDHDGMTRAGGTTPASSAAPARHPRPAAGAQHHPARSPG